MSCWAASVELACYLTGCSARSLLHSFIRLPMRYMCRTTNSVMIKEMPIITYHPNMVSGRNITDAMIRIISKEKIIYIVEISPIQPKSITTPGTVTKGNRQQRVEKEIKEADQYPPDRKEGQQNISSETQEFSYST